jgi:hyperosmotically inducible periplasmic protein
MITHTQKLVFSAALLIVPMTMSANVFAEDKSSQPVTDARQEAQIWTTYALSPYLRANDLKVSVSEGKATLTGGVEEDVDKDLAKQIALGVSGIKTVDNQIKVDKDYKPAKSSGKDRSYGQIVDDASITAKVKSKLLWSKNSDGLTTNVDTESGKVTLNGDADSDAAKELAGQLARNTHGVLSVDNKLVVKKEKDDKKTAKVSKKSTTDMGDKVSDGWITTKVKATFIYSSNVDSSDISVSTQDGVVTLSGVVSNGTEGELAIALAQNIKGVKSVESGELTNNS